jgi:hypothetical protein
MELQNRTRFPAMLLTTVIDRTRMSASVVVRVTYDLRDGELRLSESQPWMVSQEPWQSPLGPFEADQPYRKGGVDLLVAGEGRTPAREPQTELRVSVAVGSFSFSALVFGARVWQRDQEGGLAPTAPEPFVALPLASRYAFGGQVEVDGLALPHADNPTGIGFYADEASALGQPLPRIEDPEDLIKTWSDRPDPVLFGICPLQNGQRLRAALEVVEGEPPAVKSRLFNMAYPRAVAPQARAGDTVVLSGFSHDGAITFRIPPSDLTVQLTLGDMTVERALTIEEVGMNLPEEQVFIGYRYPFRYHVVPHQRRACVLSSRGE